MCKQFLDQTTRGCPVHWRVWTHLDTAQRLEARVPKIAKEGTPCWKLMSPPGVGTRILYVTQSMLPSALYCRSTMPQLPKAVKPKWTCSSSFLSVTFPKSLWKVQEVKSKNNSNEQIHWIMKRKKIKTIIICKWSCSHAGRLGGKYRNYCG